jgi:hypothetical protein
MCIIHKVNVLKNTKRIYLRVLNFKYFFMASFEIIGTLKTKQDTQVISEKFSKREFVLTTDTASQYPQYISMQLTQDKCSLLDSYQLGEELKVSFNIRGREWNNPTKGLQYFNSLEAWRIERASAAAPVSNNTPQATPMQAANASSEVISSNEIADDLPF